jgi:hypothetical protein
MYPNTTFTKEKNCPKQGLMLQFSKNLPKVNNRSKGENSPNLVTLLTDRSLLYVLSFLFCSVRVFSPPN